MSQNKEEFNNRSKLFLNIYNQHFPLVLLRMVYVSLLVFHPKAIQTFLYTAISLQSTYKCLDASLTISFEELRAWYFLFFCVKVIFWDTLHASLNKYEE